MCPQFARLLPLVCVFFVPLAHAEGEAGDGFPDWSGRLLLEWMNRARSDPQTDLAPCSTCGEKACYSPVPPRHADTSLLHSSRFHADHMVINGYYRHPSQCTLVSDIASIYPQTCAGAASCSCTQGALTANDLEWTNFFTRAALFGGNADGEVLASGFADPDAAFYGMLYEASASSACGFSDTDALRYEILTDNSDPLAGAGFATGQASDSRAVMDFGYGTPGTSKIPSGAHFPRQAASVDAWTNWYDSAGPSVHKIDVDGVCSDMGLSRGSQANGAWQATVSGVGSGCHRYLFAFKDSGGNDVLYPTTGSLAIGDGSAQCPDWSSAAPAGCAGFDRIFANGMEP